MNDNKTESSASSTGPVRDVPAELRLGSKEHKADILKRSWDGWMRADHYHCKSCTAEMIFWGRLPWTAVFGVRSVGACRNCSLIMIEYETELPKWIDIDKA